MSTNDPRNAAGSPHLPPLEAKLVEPPQSNVLGVVGLVFSILGLVTCGLASPFGVICSGIAVFKRPRGAAGIGLAVGLAGCLLAVVVGTAVGRWAMDTAERFQELAGEIQEEVKASQETVVAVQAAEKAIHDWQTEHTGELPDLKTGQELIAEFRDGWRQPLEYQLKGVAFDVRSIGKDQLPDTLDDVYASTFDLPETTETTYELKVEKAKEGDDN